MPVDNSVESLLALPDSSFHSPVKATGKDAAPQDDRNAEEMDSDGDGDEESGAHPPGDSMKPTRPWNGRADWRLIQVWNIGHTQTQPVEDSRQECFVLCRKFMDESRVFKLPTHTVNPTDIYLWKQFRNYGSVKKGGNKRVFRCPMFNRCCCKAGVKIVETENMLSLYYLGEHNQNSHDDDKSKYLKHKQIVAVHEGARICPQQSAAVLRRNLSAAAENSPEKQIDPKFLRSIRHRVKTVRKQLTIQKLEGFHIDDSYGSLFRFCVENKWESLVQEHNSGGAFHLDMYTPVVIGFDIQAAHDIVNINISNPHFLLNAFRAINSGWVFQLNADGTFNFCKHNVDMIGFGVNSIGGHNHPLCWSLIPSAGEGKLTYTKTFLELQSAVLLLDDIVLCKVPGCAFCEKLTTIFDHPRTADYVHMEDSAFREDRLPIDSAQCDNILGFGNFTLEVLDMDPNICKNHALGKLFSFPH